MSARTEARTFLPAWVVCCLIFIAAYAVAPATAFGAFTPTQQDSLALTDVYAPETEAFPEAIALGPSGTVYYTHSDRNRSFELSPDPSNYIVGLTFEGVEMFRVGQSYAGDLRRPAGIDFTSDGMLVIADSENGRVRVLDPATGQFIYTFGEVEFGDAQFAVPSDVCVGSDDTLWIADTYHSKIQHTTLWGGFINEFTLPNGEYPDGIATDAAGNLWIAVPTQNKVVKYSPEGELLATIDGWDVTDSQGAPTGSDSFIEPRAIGVDPWGVVYVGDTGNGRLVRLAADGTWLGSFNPGDVLIEVSDLDIDAFGNVFASDPVTDAIYRFQFVMAGDDSEPPITATNIPTGWRNTPMIVTLDAMDNANNILGTWYSIDGSFPTIPYTGPFAISTPGVTAVKFYSVDEAQNFETVKTRYVRLDYVKPSTTSNAQAAYGTIANIVFTGTDDLSGVSRTEYSLNGGNWKTGATFTTSVGGTHTLRFRSIDAAGNVEDFQTVEFTVTPRVDQSAPGIYYQGTWTPYTSGSRVGGYWLAANEPGAFVYFQFEGQGFTLIGSKASTYGIAKVTIDGTDVRYADLYAPSTLHKQSVLSVAGLENDVHSVKIEWTGTRNPSASGNTIGLDAVDFGGELLVDDEPPFTALRTEYHGWANTPVTLELDATDDGTWVTQTYYRVDGGQTLTYTGAITLQEDGVRTITFWSVDKAGNVEPPTMTTVYTDWTPPTTTSNVTDEWHPGDFEVLLDATDAVTGVRETLYSVADGEDTVYTEPFFVTEEGETEIHFLSVDNLDNEEERRTATVRIDRTEPTATHELASEWAAGQATVRLIGDDALSGISGFEYTIDGGDPQFTSEYFSVEEDGDHLVTYTPVDRAGNRGPTYEVFVRIDDNAPESSALVQQRYYRTASITIASDDDQSGVDYVEYRLNGGVWTQADAITITAGGRHTLEYRAVDVAGNVEPTKTAQFTVIERFDDGDSRMVFEGPWSKAANASRHNGSWAYANGAGAKAVVKFTGTSVDFIGGTAPNYGKALLRVDGEPRLIVDMYTSGYTHNRVLGSISDLTYGVHELTVEWTGTKNTNSLGTGIGIDALDIDASLVQPVLRYEETHPFMSWYGAWVSSDNVKRSAGSWVYTNSMDAEMKFSFIGTGAQLFASTAPNYGIASVKVDGGAAQGVDLYTSGYLHNHPVWSVSGLEYGIHTITVAWTGTKHPASTGTGIGFDAVEAIGGIVQAPLAGPALVRHEESDARIILDGTWVEAANASRSGGKWRYTNASGSVAAVAFTGSRIDIIGSTAPNYGRALVTVDGTHEYVADFYTAGYIHNRKILSISGLDNVPHTVTIEWTGTKNSASTGTGIGLDAIEIVGSLRQAAAPGYPIASYEETDPSITATGAWIAADNAKRSAGSWIYSNTEGSAVEFEFSGTRLELRGSKAPNYGIARVVIDGVPYPMDLYSSGYIHNTLAFSSGKLSDGVHTVRIEWTGTANRASTGTGIGFDAADVQGVMIAP